MRPLHNVLVMGCPTNPCCWLLLLALSLPSALDAAWLPRSFGRMASTSGSAIQPKALPLTSTSHEQQVSGHVIYDDQAEAFKFVHGLSQSDGGASNGNPAPFDCGMPVHNR